MRQALSELVHAMHAVNVRAALATSQQCIACAVYVETVVAAACG
jgi:hypothetical protein